MGLAFVAMSRCRDWVRQAFRRLPSFWEFRKVLQQPLFQWRSLFEQRMDTIHGETMEHYHGMPWTVEMDVAAHATWPSQRSGRELSQAELEDLQGMLSVRGVKEVLEYLDEPTSGPRGPRGGGGRKRHRGCQPDKAKRQ